MTRVHPRRSSAFEGARGEAGFESVLEEGVDNQGRHHRDRQRCEEGAVVVLVALLDGEEGQTLSEHIVVLAGFRTSGKMN